MICRNASYKMNDVRRPLILRALTSSSQTITTRCHVEDLENPPNDRRIKMDDGAKIFAQVEGTDDGKPIVLVHGWGLDHKMWKFQLSYLREHGYMAVAVDLRGFGQSIDPKERYTYERWANDLHAVMQELNLDDATLAGHSMGGAIAMYYAATHPDSHAQKLALIAAAGPCLAKRPDNPDGLPEVFFDDLIALLEKRSFRTSQAVFSRFYGTTFLVKRRAAHLECIPKFLDIFLRTPHEALIGGLKELRDEDDTQAISQINVKTMICHGTHDPVVHPGLAKKQQELIKGASLIWFEKSGHYLFLEEDAKLNQELNWLLEI